MIGITTPFVALLFLTTLPFWLAAELFPLRVLPGLPISAFMTICPMLAALILWGKNARKMLASAFAVPKLPFPAWLAITLLMPASAALSYLIQRSAGQELPHLVVPFFPAMAMAMAFVVAALAEELGWSAYAADRLHTRLGIFRTGVMLGIVWAAWHVIPFLQGGRSWQWIAWQCLFTVAFRVILVGLYSATGKSIWAVALCHAGANLAAFLFPALGSHYNPGIMFALALPVAALAVGTARPDRPPSTTS